MKTLQEKTQDFLARSGWSQERLAKEIGVTRVNLNRFLNRQKRVSTGEKLAAFLKRQEDEGSVFTE